MAQVEALKAQCLVRRLSGQLDRQYRLVTTQGVIQPGAQCLSQYRFRHYLFQQYLYQSLDQAERAYLHEAVGNSLEALYQGQTQQVAVQLVWHFQEAGLGEKAVIYLLQAGQQALRLSAHTEAVAHLRQGLAVLSTLPATLDRAQQELDLRVALINALIAMKGSEIQK